MKKIMILSNNSVGLYLFRKELISALAVDNIIFVSAPDTGFSEELNSLGCQLINTSVDRRGINPLKDIRLTKDYFSLLIKEKPDLIITYTIKPNIYGGFTSRILRIPYVTNITGLGSSFEKEGLLKNLVLTMYKCILKWAKTVYFENSDNRDLFIEKKIVKNKQAVLLNGAGVNLDQYVLSEYPNGKEPVKFLYVGRIMKEKGIDEIFQAMIKLRDEGIHCTLDILGRYEEDYKAKIEQYQKEGWLKYHGIQKDIRPFIVDSHCFVLPSWHEGMANTNLECAASGRPVITSNIPGCREAVIENISGYLCERHDSYSLYNAMNKFVQLSYEERKNMGLAGRKHMEEKFDKKKVVAATIARL